MQVVRVFGLGVNFRNFFVFGREISFQNSVDFRRNLHENSRKFAEFLSENLRIRA